MVFYPLKRGHVFIEEILELFGSERLNINDGGSNIGTISYIYDATGVKLEKKVSKSGTPNKYTYYAGNYVYEGSSLKFFNHPEGYVDAVNGYKYVYQYKDHLGNIRLSYQDANQNNSNPVSLQILEENNYYPFGLKHKGYNFVTNSTNIALKRKFGGKEYQDELGLNWYDITARNYDPALGRWMNLDPLAEQMRRFSPYNYAFNNPLYFIDPDGMAPTDEWDKLTNGDLVWKSKKGGDTTDYVNNVDEDGNVTSTDTYEVQDNRQVSETSEVSHTFKEPGVRYGIIGKGNKDGSMPLIEVIPELTGSVTDYFLGKVGLNSTLATIALIVINPKSALKKLSTKGKNKGSLSATKEAVTDAKKKIGLDKTETLPKGNDGKFGSPQRGDSKKGYRLDPAHPNAKPDSPEAYPHVNYWDYTKGKRGKGGVSGAIPIKE